MEIKQNTAIRVPVRLVNSVTGAAMTGVAFGSVTAYLQKQGTAPAAKTMASADWFELDATNMPGVYDLLLSSTDTNTVGFLKYSVSVAGGDPYFGLLEIVANLEADTYARLDTIASVISGSTFSTVFTVGQTPFGIFDSDSQFQADAGKLVAFVSRKLGESQIQVELSSSDVYVAFEESCLEYSATVNMYQAKSVLSSLLGSATGTLGGQQNRYPQLSLEWQRRMAQAYGDEAMVGGNRPLYSASIGMTTTTQDYDLQTLINPTGSDGLPRRMIIRDIFHFSPLSAFRFFGTTSAINYMHNQFGFESFTPETIFYLLPIWEDILRGMQFETSNRVRRSNYSYELHNNVLKVFPIPTTALNLHFTYHLADESPFGGTGVNKDKTVDGVANISNVPFGNIEYSKLNSISKTWIWKFTLALCKETLGYVRRKMMSIPIPNGELTLDGEALVQDAHMEMETLRSDLKEMLEATTYDKLYAKEAEQAAALAESMKFVPLAIWVGR